MTVKARDNASRVVIVSDAQALEPPGKRWRHVLQLNQWRQRGKLNCRHRRPAADAGSAARLVSGEHRHQQADGDDIVRICSVIGGGNIGDSSDIHWLEAERFSRLWREHW